MINGEPSEYLNIVSSEMEASIASAPQKPSEWAIPVRCKSETADFVEIPFSSFKSQFFVVYCLPGSDG